MVEAVGPGDLGENVLGSLELGLQIWDLDLRLTPREASKGFLVYIVWGLGGLRSRIAKCCLRQDSKKG